MMKREVVENYFIGLENMIKRLQLEDKPAQIWNCDEIGLQFSPNSSKVIAPKGVKSLVERCSTSKENITTLVTVYAAGAAMSPMCVVKEKTKRSILSFSTQDTPKGTICAFQESG